MTPHLKFWLFGAVLAGLCLLSQAQSKTELSKPISSEQLGGEQRQLLYLSTDKPIYRAQETLYLRAVVLSAKDNTPYDAKFDLSMEIQGPKGETVYRGHAVGEDSAAALQWAIPAGSVGGQYAAVVRSPSLGIAQTRRHFDVRAYRAPRLKSQIEFIREAYGPGDTVRASVNISRAEGGIPRGAKISAIARLDGQQIYSKSGLRLDEQGNAYSEFELPQTIAKGQGSLSFVVEDGGVLETASKTLPIILQTLDIQFYPEGGDLVAGLDNRIYLQARRPDGKPADVSGKLVVVRNQEVIRSLNTVVSTEHEGRGLFSLKPQAGVQYALVVNEPAGIKRPYILPKVRASGAVLSATQDVYAFDEPIGLNIASQSLDSKLMLTLYRREQLLDSLTFNSSAEVQNLELDAGDAEGVLMATLWSGAQPLAERLIYRQPKYGLKVDIQADRQNYVPGAPVNLEITTTNSQGQAVEAVVGLTVTDDAVLELIEDRDKAPRLPTMVYLEPEVRELADAQVYLDQSNPRAAQSLDLLLGTQGWRRFALLRFPSLMEQFEDLSKRMFAVKEPQILRRQRAAFGIQPQRKLEQVEVQAMRAPEPPPIAVADQPPEVEERFAAAAAQAEPLAAGLRAQGPVANALVQEDIALERDQMIAPRQYYVREYAHKARANRQVNDRVDFAETLYWHKGIKTSARNGKAKVSFELSDSVTQFRVMADVFGRNGALAAADELLTSAEPFYIEPKMPLAATVGDVIELPIAVVNASDKKLEKVQLLVQAKGLKLTQAKPLSLAPGERGRRIVRIEPGQTGQYSIVVQGAGGGFSDTVTRTLKVEANGFPVSINHGGLLSAEQPVSHTVLMPAQIEAGSLRAVAKVHPSPLASMEEALNALLREPFGCFEQTSSTTYPLVMAQQYFINHSGVSPQKISQAKALLQKGYQRLLSFETTDQGYEWFGSTPAHEALTAYGLMEFADMAKVMDVDAAMMDRTRAWLLSRRDGEGGFKRNEKALDSFGRAPQPTTNAYIVWALLESGEPPGALEKEIAAVKSQALSSDDSYILALAANIMYLANDPSTGANLSQRLVKRLAGDGSVAQAQSSITRSGGDSLLIETTSLAILAWLKDDERWAAQVEKAMQWLFERSKAGRFGATQATVLALKAINAYDAARSQPARAGQVQLWLDGEPFGPAVAFTERTKGAIELPNFAAALSPGEHRVELRMSDGSRMPYALEIGFNTLLPNNPETSPLAISTALSQSELREGELTEMNIDIEVGPEDAPTPIAIIGIPAGLELRHEQLKEWLGAERISAYEVADRELILYWRALKAEQKLSLPLALSASIPGRYTAPASRAYLYYTDELKTWQAGTQVSIKARQHGL